MLCARCVLGDLFVFVLIVFVLLLYAFVFMMRVWFNVFWCLCCVFVLFCRDCVL